MHSLATTHGLSVAGALFMLGGLAILGSALLSRTTLAAMHTSLNSAARLSVAAWFAIPVIGAGLFLQAAGSMADVSMGPGLTALLLALAFAIVLFVMSDETIADALAPQVAVAVPAASDQPQLALPAPIREAIAEAMPANDLALAS